MLIKSKEEMQNREGSSEKNYWQGQKTDSVILTSAPYPYYKSVEYFHQQGLTYLIQKPIVFGILIS